MQNLKLKKLQKQLKALNKKKDDLEESLEGKIQKIKNSIGIEKIPKIFKRQPEVIIVPPQNKALTLKQIGEILLDREIGLDEEFRESNNFQEYIKEQFEELSVSPVISQQSAVTISTATAFQDPELGATSIPADKILKKFRGKPFTIDEALYTVSYLRSKKILFDASSNIVPYFLINDRNKIKLIQFNYTPLIASFHHGLQPMAWKIYTQDDISDDDFHWSERNQVCLIFKTKD